MDKDKNIQKFNVPESYVRNIANKDPANFEDSLPLVRSPDCAVPRVVDLYTFSKCCHEVKHSD
jgi:hypothetical protein